MRQFLKDFAAFMEEQPFKIIRLSEVQGDGEIETWEMQEANPCQDTYSVSKTFVMTGIGLLWDRGLISLDEKLTDILDPELSPETKAKMDPRWHLATVEMALTHRLGLPGGFLDIDCCNVADFGEDYLAYTMTYPLAYTPGTDEKYSDGAFYLLARAAAVRTGVALDRYLWPNLFYPLGYREMAWSCCPHGHPVGGSGLYIDAFCNGLDAFPDVDPSVRQGLLQRLEKEGLEPLRFELRRLDPETFATIDTANRQRVVRALEVCIGTGKPFSSFKTAPSARSASLVSVRNSMTASTGAWTL